MVLWCSDTRAVSLASLSLLDNALQLGDFHGVFILHAGELSQVSILQNGMGLSKEVIDHDCKLVTWLDQASLLAVLVYEGVDATRHRVISQITLILAMERVEQDSTLARSSH